MSQVKQVNWCLLLLYIVVGALATLLRQRNQVIRVARPRPDISDVSICTFALLNQVLFVPVKQVNWCRLANLPTPVYLLVGK